MKAEILNKTQRQFLAAAGKIAYLEDNFYLTGGTALSAFYLGHRYSEDLDFFSENEVDMINIDSAVNALKKDTGAKKVDFEQSYNRNLFFFHFDKMILKTEFTYFPFSRIEKNGIECGISIDSLIDIAVNKLFTIYQRSAARDYIDLYFICKEKKWKIGELIKKAKLKFDWHIDPLQLGTQFIKSAKVEDYPKMIKSVSAKEWRLFFSREAKKLKSEILAD